MTQVLIRIKIIADKMYRLKNYDDVNVKADL